MSRLRIVISLIVLAGGWSSCKDDPTSPPPPNKQDTTKRTLTISFDSSTATVNKTIIFTVKATPSPLPKPYKILWTIDTSHFDRLSVDTISFTFTKGGSHLVQARYIDSTGSHRDSALSSAAVFDPADTTSHDFVWKEFTNVQGQNNMTGVWVFGPNDIIVCNWDLYKFDGASWTRETLNGHAPGSLSGASIFGFAHTDFWLIYGSILYHWNGSAVEETCLENIGVWHYPQDGVIHGAWGTSSKNMYFVGDSGTILHFDGANWIKMNTPTRKRLDVISGLSNNDIWASGYDEGKSEVLHYDGSTWTQDAIASSGIASSYGLDGVFECDSAGHNVLVTAGSTVFRRTDNGSWWKDASVPNGDHIGIGISGQSANDFFALGGWGVVAHWSGKSWKRYDQFYEPNNPVYGAGGASYRNNTLCVVGVKNGTSWVLVGQRK